MPESTNKDQDTKTSSPKVNALQKGQKAPDFTLKSTPDQTVSLSEFKGQPVILAFYPNDWSPVCGDELALFNELLPEFHKYQAQIIGISVDSAWSHDAFAKQNNIHFPLLADFQPKGEVARKYGVYREQDGTAARALFVLEPNGVIYWSYVSPTGVNPGADGILSALEEMKKEKEPHGTINPTH